MTSKDETQKTSEFLHRRKLRLQQVREQSKDIAKKIRQRAKVEKLRQVVELDQKKERDYLQNQERVVKKLEELYSRGLDNVGSSHQKARGLTQTVSDTLADKNDLSHVRGREAAAELRKQKQQKFNEIKRALDRKVQAREAANVLSREKSATAVNKLHSKSTSTKLKVDETVKSTSENINEGKEVTRSDMGTQWDTDLLPAEWEPNIPVLNLPKDEESVGNSEKNTDKQKRPDLFAVSDEMPASLRGGTHKPCDAGLSRISSTLVSEYIQNRALRLRESEVSTSKKKHSEDLKNLRQTIIRSRPLRPGGSDFNSNICHVVEGQVVPIPKWQAETGCQCAPPRISLISQPLENNLSATHHIEMFSSSVHPMKPNSVSCCVPKKARPITLQTFSGNSNESLLKGKGSENLFTKKRSITMYNHSTRDSRDVPRVAEQMVHRDCQSDKDAYSRALSESTSAYNCEKQTHKQNHDMTNRIAVTRQNVEKEYRDTIAFLNSLPRSKNSRWINNAFKDDYRLQAQKDSRQRILQQEFKNIEQESIKQGPQGSTIRSRFPERSHNKRSRSPPDLNDEDNLKEMYSQYSWMPVPERDSNLAVHTVPAAPAGPGAHLAVHTVPAAPAGPGAHLAVHTVPAAPAGPGARPPRAAAGVQFSAVDSYHEYRSRHKHTPPTKDTSTNGRLVDTDILQDDHVSLSGSSASESSVERLAPKTARGTDDCQPKNVLTDKERIIIYKILNHKHKKKNKSVKTDRSNDAIENNKETNNTEKEVSESSIKETSRGTVIENDDEFPAVNNNDLLSSEDLDEGVYKVLSNTTLCYNILNTTKVEPWQSISDRKYWWDNLESMYYAELNKNQRKIHDSKSDKSKEDPICSNKAEGNLQKSRKKCTSSKCKSRNPVSRPAAETSSHPAKQPAPEMTSCEAGFVKLIDDGEKRDGNFYIGATGFLKDDAYEVIIQLRKKETGKVEEVKEVEAGIKIDAENENAANAKKVIAQPLPSQDHVRQEMINVSEHSPVETEPHTDDISAVNPSQDNKSTAQQCPSSTGNDGQTTTKTTRDRSVSPISKDIYTLSEPVTKSDPIARPATSTYTQTTLSSPNPKPAYIHMSSSTSTAYMSPPEVVLPNILKRRHERCRKELRSARNIERQEGQKVKCQEHYCKKYCSCKISKKILPEPTIDQSDAILTAADVRHGTYNKNMYKGKTETTLSSPDFRVMEHRCLKSKERADSKPCLCCKQHSHKIKQANAAKHSKSIWNTKNSNVRSKKSSYTHSSKPYLNPRIKEYIHRLLSYNTEGINAIQIINQECSSVNTPGSSIINVPTNRSNKRSQRRDLDISLEQIVHVLRQRIFLTDNYSTCRPGDMIKTEKVMPKNIKLRRRNSKKKKLHKVKSLNISKKINKKPCDASTSTRVSGSSKMHLAGNKRAQRLPASEKFKSHADTSNRNMVLKTDANKALPKFKDQYVSENSSSGQPKTAVSSENSSSNSNEASTRSKCFAQPINTSTQTNRTIEEEMNFIKLAEGKLQNMEKIADLTEKCSKRLSNLAKVLEEVRKNKSLAYSQVSTPDSTSDSDQRPDKIIAADSVLQLPPTVSSEQISENVDSTDYESLIPGVPELARIESSGNEHPENILSDNTNRDFISKPSTTMNEECRVNNTKCRNKPPPALLRINLKRPQENVVPHELSTVIEVDSPLSVKLKSLSSSTNISQSTKKMADPEKNERPTEKRYLNPELIMSIVNKSSNDKIKMISTDSSDDSKLQMMDVNQFNEIMLRPFISLQEYAQDYFEVNMDTKCESTPKDNGFTEDISSLHSDGSLPDVVAELLKRKLITEPFRFDTASNVNSTTVSSESSLSALALLKPHKDKNKSKLSANKENVGEVSDSLSISSNPDLENAFKKLGMGWASSTLKKTKERLALSSSSNTSSSSLSQIKFKNSSKQQLVSDSISTVPNVSRKTVLRPQLNASRNAEQQTSFTNSMTVKEFLTKELAKKITFTEKSDRNDTNLEFVSLFETKLPEGLKKSSQTLLENDSGESAPSGNNNRARTSTPVNVLKSVTYRSSSSSNMSNGLFSNADDLSSVKLTSTSVRYQSTSEKDELTIPNCSLKMRKALSDCSKTDSC